MWGRKSFKYNSSDFAKRSEKIILHASTFKSYFVRPYIYESAFEYIIGINKLIKSIEKFKDIKLIIRVRPTPDCSYETLKDLIIGNKNVIIKKDGSFLDDLKRSTLLVSFSSTTIEEALYERIPVAIHGYSKRFNHFEGVNNNSQKRSAIYNFDDKNIKETVKFIFENHYNSPLGNQELSNFIWNDNEVDLKSVEDFKNYNDIY